MNRRDLIQRLAAGEEVDCDLIRGVAKRDPASFFKALAVAMRPRLHPEPVGGPEEDSRGYADALDEFLPASVFYCLVECDPAFLATRLAQRQIEHWQYCVRTRKPSADRKAFSDKLRGIGKALDPAAGRGNRSRSDDTILFFYEDLLERFKTLRREVRADLKEARRKRLSMDPRIRAAALAYEEKYRELLGDYARGVIEAVINRERIDPFEIPASMLGMSRETVRKAVQRARKKTSRGISRKKRVSSKK